MTKLNIKNGVLQFGRNYSTIDDLQMFSFPSSFEKVPTMVITRKGKDIEHTFPVIQTTPNSYSIDRDRDVSGVGPEPFYWLAVATCSGATT